MVRVTSEDVFSAAGGQAGVEGRKGARRWGKLC